MAQLTRMQPVAARRNCDSLDKTIPSLAGRHRSARAYPYRHGRVARVLIGNCSSLVFIHSCATEKKSSSRSRRRKGASQLTIYTARGAQKLTTASEELAVVEASFSAR